MSEPKNETGQAEALKAAIDKLPDELKKDIAWYLDKVEQAKEAGMDLWHYLRVTEYDPQAEVAEMMHIFGQEVRPLPTMIEDPKERLLAANLVLEEALEFCKALGFDAIETESEKIVLVENAHAPNLKEAIDAVGDILVVTYGGANRLGANAKDVFKEVDRSNKSKIWPDGTIRKRPEDGKVIKPDTYSPADIEKVMCEQKPLVYATPSHIVENEK